MIQTVLRALAGLALITLASAHDAGSAQEAQQPRLTLSADPVPLGHTVELRVSVHLPAGQTVYFPETLPTNAFFESQSAPSVTAEPEEGGSILHLSYPLIAFGTGRAQTPEFGILVGPGEPQAGRRNLPGGATIGAWTADLAGSPGIRNLATVAPQEVRVASLAELEGVLGGVGPMPPAAVVGSDWNSTAIALAGVSSLILVSLVAAIAARAIQLARSRRRPEIAPLAGDGRQQALDDLDGLLALELHKDGQLREFYRRTSAIVRRYVERFDSRWGPNLTSIELVRKLQAQGEPEQAATLSAELGAAEVVKFGQAAPDPDAATSHWRTLRAWVDASAERQE